jgi:pimeloyl-ACP methyl ester carboxylesterase
VIPHPQAVIDSVAADGSVLTLRRYGRANAATRLFISHGNGFATDGYVQFWSRFLAGFDVVVFDMRNHGWNPPSEPANHDYAHMVQDIDAVGRAVRAEFGSKPAAGVFHSMSAQAALLHTITGGDHFASLVLFDPPNVPPAETDPAYPAMLSYLRRLTAWAAQRPDRFADPTELAEGYARTRSGRLWADETAQLMARAVLRQQDDAWVLACPRDLESSMYRQGIDLGLWPARHDFPIPVTLIGADPDGPYPAATGLANRSLARDGGFEYLTIPASSHLMQLEQPAACAEAVLAALDRVRLA